MRSTPLIFLVILALGTFIRFYNLSDWLIFHGELGHNYLAIKNFLNEGRLPLLGPPTSHPWLYFGPLFYWLFAPVLVLFKFEPIAGAYFFAFLGSLTIIINFVFVKKIFNERVALISSFLTSISPLFIDLTREARFFSLVVPLFYPFLYSIVKIGKGRREFVFWAALLLGLMLNFHYTPIILFPVLFAVMYKQRKKLLPLDYVKLGIGTIIPMAPFVLHNALSRFEMVTQLALWVPYRILGFLGIISKNTVDKEVAYTNLISFTGFIRSSFLPAINNLDILFVVAFICVLIYLLFNFRNLLSLKLLILILAVGGLALFIHGTPPMHYFLPLFPIPIILISLFLDIVWQKWEHIKYLSILVFAGISYANFIHYTEASFQKYLDHGIVEFNTQSEIAREIVRISEGKEFSLSRIGPFDYFDGDYAQNYQYLLWLYGNEPVKISRLHYSIVEPSSEAYVSNDTPEFIIDGVRIYKNE